MGFESSRAEEYACRGRSSSIPRNRRINSGLVESISRNAEILHCPTRLLSDGVAALQFFSTLPYQRPISATPNKSCQQSDSLGFDFRHVVYSDKTPARGEAVQGDKVAGRGEHRYRGFCAFYFAASRLAKNQSINLKGPPLD